jgi:ribonuclease HII
MFRGLHEIPSGLNDSKQLSRRARDVCYEALIATNIAHGIGIATAEEIDALNIWGATQLAMRRAVEALPTPPDIALIDGKIHPKPFMCKTHTIIGGDGVSLSIAAASILAKVTRDRLMDALAKHYPMYGFEKHAGYGTKQHREALALHGPCPAHRRSYAPIRALLEKAVA